MTSPRTIRRIIHHFMVFCILLSGCGRDSAPHYDQTKLGILKEYFNAIESQNYHVAIRKLERINELNNTPVASYRLIRYLKDNDIIANVNTELELQQYQAALDSIDHSILIEGNSERLSRERSKIAGFVQLKNYPAHTHFTTSGDALAAMKQLPDPKVFGPHNQLYLDWYIEQQQRLKELDRKEYFNELTRLTLDLDRALISASTKTPLLLKHLSTLLTQEECGKKLSRYFTRDIILKELIAITEPIQNNSADTLNNCQLDTIKPQLMEMALFNFWQSSSKLETDQEWDRLISYLTQSTACGKLLHIDRELRRDKIISFLFQFHRLLEESPHVYGARIIHHFEIKFFPAMIASPVPNLGSIFTQLYRIRPAS